MTFRVITNFTSFRVSFSYLFPRHFGIDWLPCNCQAALMANGFIFVYYFWRLCVYIKRRINAEKSWVFIFIFCHVSRRQTSALNKNIFRAQLIYVYVNVSCHPSLIDGYTNRETLKK